MAVVEREPAKSPDQIRAVQLRHWGRWLSALVVLLLAAWLVQSALKAHVVDFKEVRRYQFSHLILVGLKNTVIISVVAQAVGIVLGVLLAVMRLARNPVLSSVSWFYIWFFRGTPVLVQLLFWYNAVPAVFKTLTVAVPFTGITLYSTPMVEFITPFMAAFLGLGLNEGAYMAEIVRAGILSVDEGQTEAAHALGMTSPLTMRRIVLPQAMRVIIPPTGNEFISMLKTSSLASVITFPELLRAAQDIISRNLEVFELLLVASIWYLLLTTVASIGQYYIERRYARGTSRGLSETPWQRIRRNLLGRRREWA
jgi:polar amino acid transport system permease protein